ncbi:MAG: tRNA (adenosine(37)-N6)-threonylcarbamoyltransferase complex transferase subunit TsaD [Bacilli bacterium]|nr:tRNA (adenosine(37)-N6)-threonylcarbamoyltransferase complex transferase subunit TsaD [Bacilli bacterium]
MKDIYVLAIETSCDETSASIVMNGSKEIATVVLTQMDIHKLYGGVVPEIASRHHIENITLVLEELLQKANMKIDDIDLIAVTYGPGLIGSLLIGIQAAKTLALIYNKPLIPIHHIAGHIYANKLVGEFKFPLISLVISGGHTDIIYMENEYSFNKLGGTLDDAVGEAYDKVARVLGLEYPGGPMIDKLSQIGKINYKLPMPLDDDSYNFSFSGLKSAVINLVNNENSRGNKIVIEDLAASFQDVVVNTLTKKTMKAVKQYDVKQLLIAGGVSANSSIREEFKKLCSENNVELLIPNIQYCTDNATMIGCAAYYAYKKGIVSDYSLNPKSTDNLG